MTPQPPAAVRDILIAACLTEAENIAAMWALDGQESSLDDFEHEQPGFTTDIPTRLADILWRLEKMAPGMESGLEEPDSAARRFTLAAERAAKKIRALAGSRA